MATQQKWLHFLKYSHRSHLSKHFGRQQCINKIFFYYVFVNAHKGNITALSIFFCLSVLSHYAFKIHAGFYSNSPKHYFNFYSWYRSRLNMAGISIYHSILVSCFLRFVILICNCVSFDKKPKIKTTID